MPYVIRSMLLLLVIAKPVFAQAPQTPNMAPSHATEANSSTYDASAVNEKASVIKNDDEAIAPQVEIKTSMGTLVITLFPKKAPVTVANFLAYVDDGFYDNSIFHRVIPGFVIQGGGFDGAMRQKQVKAPIINESDNGLANRRGTLSMARTPNPDSATSQFFINLENNTSLDSSFNKPGYAVFAKVTEGLPIIDMISRVRTGNVQQHRDVPLDPVLILSAQRKTK